jgi:uncharacterized protein
LGTLALADLDRLYPPPMQQALDKAMDHVDQHGRDFISLSSFCVISAAGPDGSIDVSPRGGEPGFVHVSEDGRTLFLPDRSGNNRLDMLRNLLGGSGRIGLMFIIPGFDDAYRVNGRATATTDDGLLARFIEFGKRPRLVLSIDVEEAFIHCPKAMMRARLWKTETWQAPRRLRSVVQMIADQTRLANQPVTQDQVVKNLELDF